MLVELHCHSVRSDGSREPDDVARMAEQRGVKLFCLTDHDTWSGYSDTCAALADAPGITVLRGMELSCRAHGRTVHLLAYGLDSGPGLQALERRLEHVLESRRQRIIQICARLEALGIELDPQRILIASHGSTPGRPDVARALVNAGVVTSAREAFTRFLRDGGPADVPIDRLTLEEGVELCRAAGARLSLAHPHALSSYDLVKDLFQRLRDAGLEGLEAYYGRYAQAERIGWLRLASELDLVVTGGSDFHGDMMPDVTMPGIELPEPHARRLCQWLGV